ncbi:hypothetical protein [Bradyrhizobium sp. UFLA03-84]|uniref:hypothetical protein n=1 Tax=Bradyrhizobium sp. UFLA03-84 TaxID=418599 RepID=UPI0018EA1CDF|nr:hypothetical protein [Bradyrhizobium sp. UFLA03-84]
MVTTMISAKDLELVALRELRSVPGGEYIAHVEVDLIADDWRLNVTVRDGADVDRIQDAVKATTNRLKQRYVLRPDW